MGDPEVTATQIWLKIQSLLAELKSSVRSIAVTQPTDTKISSSGYQAFNGLGGWSQWDVTLGDWKNPLPPPMFYAHGNTAWSGDAPLPSFSLGIGEGFIIGHAHDYKPGFVLPTPFTMIDASHLLHIRAGGVGNSGLWIQTLNGGDIELLSTGKIKAQDDSESFADLLGEIAGKLASASHTKAVHDALLIDADTLDTKHLIDIQNEIDADILAHAGVAAAHHAKYTDGEAVTAMGAKGDANPLNHDKYTDLDVENVITDELVDGQSIDNAIDALISNHAGVESAHQTRLHSMTATLDHVANYWKVFYSNGAGEVIELALGAANQVLTSNGAAAAPTFEDPPASADHDKTGNLVANYLIKGHDADTEKTCSYWYEDGNGYLRTGNSLGRIYCDRYYTSNGYNWLTVGTSSPYYITYFRGLNYNFPVNGFKTWDMGTSSACFDDINADDFQNRSGFKKFDNPLDLVEGIKSKPNPKFIEKPKFKTNPDTGGLNLEAGYEQPEDFDKLTIPEWIRTREKPDPSNGEWFHYVDPEGYSINRMQVLLIQAVQELSQKVKDLEQKLKEK